MTDTNTPRHRLERAPFPQPEVPPDLALDYGANGTRMAHRVSQRVAAHPEYPRLVRDCGPQLLDANHRNHASFMAEVLRGGSVSLLADSLPWVYRAYHNQGVPYDYFLIELEAWKEVIGEVLGAQRSRPVLALYDGMIDAHPRTIQASRALPAAQPCDVPGAPAPPHGEYLQALLAGDQGALLALSRGYLKSGHSFVDLLQDRFFPAMKDVGVCWEQGRISVAGEHQATSILNFVLSTLYLELDFPAAGRGHAIVAAVTNEFHELGAWMLCAGLELDGWDVTLLGSDVDQQALVAAAEARAAAFIALSVTLIGHLGAARESIGALRSALGEHCPPVLVGGRAFLQAPELAPSVGADLCLGDLRAAIAWARQQGRRP